jgi:AMP nucleosidase
MSTLKTPAAAVAALEALYDEAVAAQTHALDRFLREGTPPDGELRAGGAFCYPQLRIVYDPDGPPPPISRAYGKFSEAGIYTTTVTRPTFFRDYLIEQLTPLMRDYDIDVYVERSQSEIPYAYVWDQGQASGRERVAAKVDPGFAQQSAQNKNPDPRRDGITSQPGLEEISPAELARWFPSPKLADIGDEIADGELYEPSEVHPLALFDAQRTDFSLKRLQHYTGTPVEHFQHYVLFTNYHRYVDAFCDWATEQLKGKSRYTSLSVPGGLDVTKVTETTRAEIDAMPWRRYQMPAYHLRAPNGAGITLVNIGVGPSNAKTITDHLAVLRPQCWIMVGHCGGLRHSQAIGDYVLAHAYLREDHVLDAVLPPEIPVPPIAEVQVALAEAAARVTGETGEALKNRLRTGTVVTTDDRNWELRFTATARRFNKSRAIAIDMESATIAANGFRLRVPYGVLLCVSDKPLHGEIKLPGAANRFYERAIGEHIRIGIETLERLAADKGAKLHSRKLRAFDEPPFR